MISVRAEGVHCMHDFLKRDVLLHAKGETVTLGGSRLELKGRGDQTRRRLLGHAVQDVRRVLHLAPGKVHAIVRHQRQKRRRGPCAKTNA